ncbi:MAG: DNA polymerase Y family protein, partial [Gammaproteobacteria bacterium]|nr:DNA polymerase Y family protein [Gammaproteobacteria bacterium]
AALMLARAGTGTVVEQPVRSALNGVPLVHGDLSPKDLERLANMGITRIDELLGLPGRELGKRFGPALIDYLARLTGQKADPRAFIEPPERFDSSVHLLEPVRGKDALLVPMRKLAAELARWLARRHFGVRVLTWTVKPLTGPEVVLTVEFAHPRRDDQSFLTLSRLKLDGADLPGEVMSISLRADFVAPFSTALADLWGMTEGSFHARGYPSRSPAEGSATHAELVDLLAAKLGSGAVRDLSALDDHRPEYAWRTDQAGARAAVRASGNGPAMGHSRPLWLLDPPKPVDAGLFELMSGPERIETGWWNATAARILPEERDRSVVGSASGYLRDYYIAYSKQGARCWLYRDQNENWFLHGYFS